MTTLNVIIDGQSCEVPVGMSIAAALAGGQRRDPSFGEWSTARALRGMGVVPGVPRHGERTRVLACQTECQPEMVIERSHHAKR